MASGIHSMCNAEKPLYLHDKNHNGYSMIKTHHGLFNDKRYRTFNDKNTTDYSIIKTLQIMQWSVTISKIIQW